MEQGEQSSSKLDRQMAAELWHTVQNARIFQKFFSPFVFTETKDVLRPAEIAELHACEEHLTDLEKEELKYQHMVCGGLQGLPVE